MTRAFGLALATAALAVASAASAQGVRVERYVYEQPRYEQPRVYAYGETGPEYYEPGYHHNGPRDCRAARWDPNTRYMPGQVVRRQGKLYAATDVSSRVYNVNSPPEWTPNYWVQV